MTRPSRLAWTAAALLAALVVSWPAQAQSEPGQTWHAQSVSGDVRIERPGAPPAALKPSEALPAGATISTAGDAQAVLTRDGGDTVKLSPKSSVQIAETGATVTKLIQKLGTSFFKVTTRPTWSFEVETPYMVAVVKGTAFTVSMRSEGASVQVVEGAVQVARPDGSGAALLRPGQSITARPNGELKFGGAASAPAEKRSEAPAKREENRAEATDNARKPSAGEKAAGTAHIRMAIGAEAPDFAAATKNLVGNAAAPGLAKGTGGSAQTASLPAAATRGAASNAGGNGKGNGNAAGLANGNAPVVSVNSAGGNGNGIANGLGTGNAVVIPGSNAGGNGIGIANGLGNGNAPVIPGNNAAANGNGVANGLGNALALGGNNVGGNGNGVPNGVGNAPALAGNNAGGNGNGNGAANTGGNGKVK